MASEGTLTVQIGSHRIKTLNAFLQDEIKVRPDLALTLGAKLEHDTFDGWGMMPSAQAIWEASPGQHLWAAVSRTHRSPAVTDRDFRFNLYALPGPGLPIVVGVTGNPEYRHEELTQVQAGHRIRIGSDAALETTVFTGRYDGLPTYEPLEPTVELASGLPHVRAGVVAANLLNARVSGVELNARWNPLPQWEIEASYANLHLTPQVDPASLASLDPDTDGNAPEHQWEARTTISLRPGVDVGASLWRVGRLYQLAVPAYTRLDARAQFRLNSRLTAALVGQNLSNRRHREFASDFLFLTSSLPRGVRLDLRWQF